MCPSPLFHLLSHFWQLFPAVVTSEGNRCLRTNQALPRHNTPSATHSQPASQGHREWALPGLRAKAQHCLSGQTATSFWFSRSLSVKQGSFQFKDVPSANVFAKCVPSPPLTATRFLWLLDFPRALNNKGLALRLFFFLTIMYLRLSTGLLDNYLTKKMSYCRI